VFDKRMADSWLNEGVRASSVLGSPIQNLLRAMGFVAVIFVLATIGFMHAGWSFGDAIYMVTLTIFSVGYGEVQPVDTTYLRVIAMSTIVLGCTGMIVFTGALIQVFAHYQLRRMLGVDRMNTEIDKLSGHAIICGFGRIGVELAKELSKARQSFVVLERSPARIAEAQAAGYLCFAGDATDERALHTVGIERARVLATVLPDDAANVFITLSARNLNARLEIIARGEAPTTEGKLIHAGADKVVMPTHIGAERIAEMILYPTTAKFIGESPHVRDLKRGLHEFGLELEAVTVPREGALTGATVAEAERRGAGAFFIVQIDRADGHSFVHPGEDVRIEAADTVVLVLRNSRVSGGAIFGAPRQPIRMGRTFAKRAD
jgi:voltage-gated potassium channel